MKISILIGQKGVPCIHCIHVYLHSIVAWNVFVLTQRYNYLTATNKSFLTFFFTGCCPSGFTTFIRMMNPHCSTQLCSIVDLKIFCLLLVWRRLHNHLTRYFNFKLMFLDVFILTFVAKVLGDDALCFLLPECRCFRWSPWTLRTLKSAKLPLLLCPVHLRSEHWFEQILTSA